MFDVGPCLETSLVFDEACHLGFLHIALPPLYSIPFRSFALRRMKPKQRNKGYKKKT